MSESTGPITVISSVAAFEFRSLLGSEELGQPFRYEVEVLSQSAALSADAMLGSMMTIKLMRRDGTPRYFNRYVTDFSLSGVAGELVVYSVTLRPWLLLLSHRARCAIYEGNAIDIVKQIADAEEYKGHSALEEGLLEKEELQSYEFVVQFRESDFDFFMRVLERDGIYYYFEHTEGHHELVLTNSGGYEVGRYSQLLYRPPSGHSTEDVLTVKGFDKVSTIEKSWTITTKTGFNVSDQEYEARVEFANGKMLIDAAQEITIQCGNSKIVLSPQAVTISAPSVNLAGNEGNVLELAAEKAVLTGTAEVVITGPMGVKVNG